MSGYAQRLEASLRVSAGHLSDEALTRLVAAVARLDPKGRQAIERLDGLIAYLVGLGPRPRLSRPDAGPLGALTAALAAPEAFGELDERLLELCADPAVWRWSSRGRVQGTSVAVAATVAQLVREAPGVDRFDTVQRTLTRRADNPRDLLMAVLGADPEVVVAQEALTSVGREIRRRLEAGDWPWWSQLYGRRAVVSVARVMLDAGEAQLLEEAERLEQTAGRAVAPELAEIFLQAEAEALMRRGSALLERAESPEALLAAARVLARLQAPPEGVGPAADWARRAIAACRLDKGDAPKAVAAAALIVRLEGVGADVVHLGARLAEAPARAALAAAVRAAPGGREALCALALAAAEAGAGAAAGREVASLLSGAAAPEAWPAAVFELLGHKKKPVRDAAAGAIAPLAVDDVGRMQSRLQEAKAAERRGIVEALIATPGDEATRALEGVAAQDRSKALRELADLSLVQRAGPVAPQAAPAAQADPGRAAVDALLARMARHLKKPARAWLDEALLPKLLAHDGQPLPADDLRLLLRIASQNKGPTWPEEAQQVARLASESSRRGLAEALLGLFVSRGASAADKFCLVAAVALGGDAAVAVVAKQVPKWPKQRRGKLAEFAVEAMAESEGELANLVLDGFARRLRTPHPKVAAAAVRALARRGERAGKTRLELVLDGAPGFGFEGRTLELEAGRRRLRVGVDLGGALRIRADDGKGLRSLPKAADEGARVRMKLLGPLLEPLGKDNDAFVEDAMLLARTFGVEAWRRAFLQDPLRFVYAARQVWLASSAEAGTSLRALEDGTLVDAEGATVTLPEGAVLRLVHPALDSEDVIEAWREHIRAFAMQTRLPQLDRPSHEVPPALSGARFDPRFEGRRCVAFERVRAARRVGWRVDGLYAGGDPVLGKTFAGPTVARLRVDGARDVALGLELLDEAGRAMPLGVAPAPLYAQVVQELEGILGAG